MKKGFTRKNFSKKNLGGFTLIELLVVIAIIGILAGVVLSSLNSARGKARDARRELDIHQINNALALYYDEHEHYPDGSGSMSALRSNNTTEWDGFSALLAPYMGEVPVDPLNTLPNFYTYTPGDVFNSTYSLTYELEGAPTAQAPITRVNANRSSMPPGGTSVVLDLALGNVVAVAQTQWATTNGTITDNLGNTYTMVPGSQQPADYIVHSWWIAVVEYPGTATISTNTNSWASVQAIQYSNINTTTPVDVAVFNTAWWGASPVFSTAYADEVILTVGHTEPGTEPVYTLGPSGSEMVFAQSGSGLQRPVVELIVDSMQTNIQTTIDMSVSGIWRTSTISLRAASN